MARVRISIVFKSGARIGPGKAKLLENIRDTGSISAAAREMGMSSTASTRQTEPRVVAAISSGEGNLRESKPSGSEPMRSGRKKAAQTAKT
jgi:hypothetical protein